MFNASMRIMDINNPHLTCGAIFSFYKSKKLTGYFGFSWEPRLYCNLLDKITFFPVPYNHYRDDNVLISIAPRQGDIILRQNNCVHMLNYDLDYDDVKFLDPNMHRDKCFPKNNIEIFNDEIVLGNIMEHECDIVQANKIASIQDLLNGDKEYVCIDGGNVLQLPSCVHGKFSVASWINRPDQMGWDTSFIMPGVKPQGLYLSRIFIETCLHRDAQAFDPSDGLISCGGGKFRYHQSLYSQIYKQICVNDDYFFLT